MTETADGAGQELADLDSELFGEAAPVPPDLHYELTLCRQGDEAVKEVQQAVESGNPYSVAFLDVRMPPGLDGVQAAERIRAFDPNINIVIVTGYSDLHPRDIAERVRPVDKFLYCQKPIQAAELEQFAHALSAKWAVERLLRATRERLEFLLASSPAVIYSRNPRDDFAVTYVSENAGPLFGWQPEDLLHGRDFWIDSIHPHDRPHVLIGMKDVLDAGRGLMEYRVRQNDGQFRWVRDESKLVRDQP